MVRRRTRAAKISSGIGNGSSSTDMSKCVEAAAGIVATHANGHQLLLEDQYFASPKRKDCKIDNEAAAAEDLTTASLLLPFCEEDQQQQHKTCKSPKTKSPSPGKIRGERGSMAGRTIGVPLATRSQTRTIENFFKANTAAKNAKLKETEEKKTSNSTTIALPTTTLTTHSPGSPTRPQQLIKGHDEPNLYMTMSQTSHANLQPDYIFDLSEDTTDTDNTELSDEAAAININAIDFATHRSTLRDSHSSRSSTTDNIFLQEPVLTLNVDKSPNQASSIKINKTLEIGPIFSSPPSLAASALNGRFNQIVSLHGLASSGGCGGTPSPAKRDSFCFESKAAMNAYVMLPPENNDNSSCDSGIAFGTTSSMDAATNSPLALVTAQTTRRRKPATPHRIVCPSPIKSSAPRVISPNGAAAGISPSSRKIAIGCSKDQMSPRKSQRHLAAASSKTRRRLNQQKEQTAIYRPTITNITAVTTNTNIDAAMQNGIKQNGHLDDVVHIIDIDPLADENNVDDDDDDGDDEEDHDQEFENIEDVESSSAFCGGAAAAVTVNGLKSILNSAKHPTAQQNTTNNNNNNINHNSHMTKGQPHTKSKSTIKTQQPKIKHQAPQPLAATNGNRELTDFFPVRRSVRKTKTAVKEEMMRNLEQAILEERAEGLKVRNFEGKGRGIIADRRFQRGEFVVEYVGDLISMTEAAKRESRYALDENAGCYMYYFKHKNQQYCIDATADTGKLGRLVNHSRNGNLVTKVVMVKQRPHLILIAKDDIEAEEELTYDYGDRSKESLLHHPWLAF